MACNQDRLHTFTNLITYFDLPWYQLNRVKNRDDNSIVLSRFIRLWDLSSIVTLLPSRGKRDWNPLLITSKIRDKNAGRQAHIGYFFSGERLWRQVTMTSSYFWFMKILNFNDDTMNFEHDVCPTDRSYCSRVYLICENFRAGIRKLELSGLQPPSL